MKSLSTERRTVLKAAKLNFKHNKADCSNISYQPNNLSDLFLFI